MKQLLLYIIFTLLFSKIIAQQHNIVDYKQITADIALDTIKKAVAGNITVDFTMKQSADSIYLDAKDMDFYESSLPFKNNKKELWLFSKFKKDSTYKVSFKYQATPKKALYFIGFNGRDNSQIWTQGQGKDNSNWLPSLDYVNDKIILDITIVFPDGYDVIANGKLTKKTSENGLSYWQYSMHKPVSSYLLAFVVGKYKMITKYSKSGKPIMLYYYPEDYHKVEPTYRYSKRIFDFLESEIGVPYPWQNYKQVPVKDFLYSGMENASITIFSDSFVLDSIAFKDRNYINVNAHELAHQWFGNLVTAASGSHHWLQEGFATYYALLAEREVFGNDYFYWQLYEYANELKRQDKAGESTALLNPKSSSVTFYKKGAIVLYLLKRKIGHKAFRTAIKNYLKKHPFNTVETADFIKEVKAVSKHNLTDFFDTWLTQKTFNYTEVENALKADSKMIQQLVTLDCNNLEVCRNMLLDDNIHYRVKQHVILKLSHNIPAVAFKVNNVYVKQTIAEILTNIPLNYKKDYEKLLQEKSYTTISTALYNLWQNFPDNRQEYLNQTKHLYGFNDYNIRILWLALALSTPQYHNNLKTDYIQELVNYTSPHYSFEIRKNAFIFLDALNLYNETVINNLIQASKHHNWRFSTFAKQLIKEHSNSE